MLKFGENINKPLQSHEYTIEQIEELDRASKDIWQFLKYVKIIHPDRGRITFEPRQFQIEILKSLMEHRNIVVLCARQVGKTALVSVYALWYAIFNDDKVIGIVSNKQSSAVDILSRIKVTYLELPPWIKPGVVSWAKTYVEFDNGTKILVSATSEDAFRGRTLNLLIADEFAFVRKHVADAFWAANYPTLAASEESRIIVISTPNGVFNLFYNLYTDAYRKINNFKHLRYDWRCVPERDEKWADEQRKNLGNRRFKQEHEVEFLGSIATVINSDVLEYLYTTIVTDYKTIMDGKLRIYEKPIPNQEYVIGVDTGKGTGNNYSTIQVLKINSIKPVNMEQVAVYRDNLTDVYTFAENVNNVSHYYNNAYIMVENNSEGSVIVNRLWWEFENENLINSGSKNADLGIRSSVRTKPRAVLLMKRLIEDGSIKIVDYDTVAELSTFVENNNRFFGKDNNDDLVSALYWAIYIVEMNIFEESFEFKPKKNSGNEEDEYDISDIISGDEYSRNNDLFMFTN